MCQIGIAQVYPTKQYNYADVIFEQTFHRRENLFILYWNFTLRVDEWFYSKILTNKPIDFNNQFMTYVTFFNSLSQEKMKT